MGWIFGNNERLLTPEEKKLIRAVFRTTKLPILDRIRIRDGLSPTGTAFTAPREKVVMDKTWPPTTTEGEYLIMVGQRLFDGDLAEMEPDTLVHEVTHVWQYKHGTLGQYEAALKHIGAAAIRRTDKLYQYNIGQSWDDMGFEGQAQLVQEWFTQDNMSETCDRWVYVKDVLMMGDVAARSLSLAWIKLSNPGVGDTSVPERQTSIAYESYPFREGHLQEVLDKAIPSSDHKGLAARVKDLEDYFRHLRRLQLQEAVTLANRLQAVKPTDRLARAFHHRLSTTTRDRLIKVLQGIG